MQGGIFTYALLAALATGLLVAAFTDLRRRQIDNWLTGAIALAAPAYWYSVSLSWPEIGFQVALAVVVFLVTAGLFALRQMGGGDVKLLVALALWITPGDYVKLLVMMGLIGGAASIAGAALNMKRRKGEGVRDAVGLTASLAWVLLCAWVAYAILAARPVISSAALDTIGAFLPNVWLAIAAVLAVLAIGGFGLVHVVRRQKTRLRIPYGVAISIGGLWILASQHFSTLQHTGVSG